MSFLELSVVIGVLLALLAIFFIGVRAWRKSSDRTANIINIRNVQLAVRSHSNSQALAIGASLADTAIIGPNKYLPRLAPPNSDITYAGGFDNVVPPIGTLYLTPNYTSATGTADYAPPAGTFSEW